MNDGISVIIPAHNDENTIVRAISSALNERRIDLQVVVVINGSDDKTELLVSQITDSRLEIIHSTTGRSNARNAGLLYAKYKFINFLDADDEFRSDHIYRAVRYLDLHNDCFAYADKAFITSDGNTGDVSIDYSHNESIKNLLTTNMFEVASTVFRNQNIKFFISSLEYCEDHVFWINNLIDKHIMFDSQHIGANKYIHGSNTMIKYPQEMIGARVFVIIAAKKQTSYPFPYSHLEVIKAIIKYMAVPSLSENPELKQIVLGSFPLIYKLCVKLLNIPLVGDYIKHIFLKRHSSIN